MNNRMIRIGDKAFSIHDVARLALGRRTIELGPAAKARVVASRRIVERYVEGTEPIYGLNTGLGGNIGHRIDREAITAFQTQLLRGRAVGIGPPLPEPVCRAALLARITAAATGGSGLSAGALDMLVALFNRGVTPAIPARGSISAADLALGAHLGLVVIGRGEAWLGGQLLPGAEALAQAGLVPAALEPKDGLALCSHSAASAGLAAVTLSDLAGLLLAAAAVAALAFEAYGANPRIFDPRVAAARPAAGQADAAALFRHRLAGSPLYEHPRSVQDALSFRCLAPVFGSALSALATARRETEIEINHAGDNPLVLLDDGVIMPTPNFHTPALAVACDALAIALAQLAAAAGQRVVKLMNPALSGLPRFLSPVGGASAGFVTQQKTAAALCAEIRQAAMPASLDAMPVSDSVEDHAPMTFLAIRKLAGQLEPLRLLVGLEAMVAAQAADLRVDGALSPRAAALRALVRSLVPQLVEDRETGCDATAIAALMARDDTIAALAADLPADEAAAAPFWGLAHDS